MPDLLLDPVLRRLLDIRRIARGRSQMHSLTRHDGLLPLKTVTPRKPETEPYSTCFPIAALFRYTTTCYGSFPANRPQNPIPTTFLGKTDRLSLPHRRDLASWKHQSTIQYTFAIQQPRPQHLPRGLAQRIFSQPPRLSTSPLPLPHGPPRRSAKNALLYVTSGSALLNCLAQRERRMGRRFRGSTIPNYIRFHWFTK